MLLLSYLKVQNIVLAGSRIFKVTGASLYNSSKEFVDNLAKPIYDNYSPHLFIQGVKVEILEPGKQWSTGKFRCRLVFEFISDKQENKNIPSQSSSLDDIRKMNL